MAEVREMERMTVSEVRQALAESQAVIVPIGCVEQHGYHLPLNTDVLTAQAAAREAAGRTGACLAPPVYYSFSGGSLPGTVNVSPEVTGLYLREIGLGLAAMGFRQIVFLTGHCGSEHMAALRGACEALARALPHVGIASIPIFEASAIWREALREGDFHAGWVETSLIQQIAPDAVRPEVVLDEPELVARMRQDPDAYKERRTVSRNRFEAPHDRQDPGIKVGVMGCPERSCPDKGRAILSEVIQTVVSVITDLVEGMRERG